MYFDMLYGVNNIDLGINVILQLMELNFGEGKLKIVYIFLYLFIYYITLKGILDQIILGIRKYWKTWQPDSKF